MSYNGTRALLMMQQTGLMDSLNAIRAIGVDYQRPVVMLVGLQGKEPDLLATTNPPPMACGLCNLFLNAMELSHSSDRNVAGDEHQIGPSSRGRLCHLPPTHLSCRTGPKGPYTS